jgi:hypothetical protein
MATYRALNDILLSGNNGYISAGTTFVAPPDYTPSGDVDPITGDAIQAFWTAGPQFSGRQPFFRLAAPPVIYWTLFNALYQEYQLTAGGASLGPRQIIPTFTPLAPGPGQIDSQPLGMP